MADLTAREFNPSNDEVVDNIKRMVNELAEYVQENVPDNRRRSIALTNFEQGSMWAVKANFYDD